MDELERYARNQRFSGLRSCIITECPGGNFALFGWGGSGPLLYLGPSLEALGQAFLSRPVYEPKFSAPPPPKPSKLVAGINLDELEIDL